MTGMFGSSMTMNMFRGISSKSMTQNTFAGMYALCFDCDMFVDAADALEKGGQI